MPDHSPTAYRQFVRTYHPIPETDWTRVEDCLNRRTVKRGELILRAGEICRNLSFLEQGLLRYYVIGERGEESNKFFTVAPYCFTSQASFFGRRPATENIQALEDAVIWDIDYVDNQRLLEMRSWSTFGRKITQEVQYFTEVILEELQTMTAEQRYRRMLLEEADLLSRLPLKEVASYLGVAPQSLSRIRKRVAKS